jgi:hypothetical protein
MLTQLTAHIKFLSFSISMPESVCCFLKDNRSLLSRSEASTNAVIEFTIAKTYLHLIALLMNFLLAPPTLSLSLSLNSNKSMINSCLFVRFHDTYTLPRRSRGGIKRAESAIMNKCNSRLQQHNFASFFRFFIAIFTPKPDNNSTAAAKTWKSESRMEPKTGNKTLHARVCVCVCEWVCLPFLAILQKAVARIGFFLACCNVALLWLLMATHLTQILIQFNLFLHPSNVAAAAAAAAAV